MQAEFDAAKIPMQIIGVNQTNFESSNDTITDGRDLPWLQDTASVNVWNTWKVTYRDVIIVDSDNQVVDVYNLTKNDLKKSDNYADLKTRLTNAAP